MKSNLEIPYTSDFIDRRADLRKDHEGLMSRINSDQSLIIATANDLNLVNKTSETPALVYLEPKHEIIQHARNNVFLGERDGKLFFNSDFSHLTPSELKIIQRDHQFIDLRTIGSQLSSFDACLAIYTRGLQYWHRTHGFCHRCGHPSDVTDGGHSRTCSNRKCSHITFPRIAPAVIVLVEHYPTDGSLPRCLLAKGNKGWGNVRSTLAGFAETGESLEETVKREMKEESGLDVYNIRYIGSQPWPFPSSLMVGFFAETDQTELTLEKEEISEANWYNINDIRRLTSSGELVLSREDSIARFLIESWVKKVGK